MAEVDLDKAAAALLSQHGKRAIGVAEARSERYAMANQREAAELWRAVAQEVRRRISPQPRAVKEASSD
jgi:hypothetical protein